MSRNRKWKASAVLTLSLASCLTSGPAQADGPPGNQDTCPPPYESITLEELLQQARTNGVPEERAQSMFEFVNKNEDAWICQEKLPRHNHYNFIDNQAIGGPG